MGKWWMRWFDVDTRMGIMRYTALCAVVIVGIFIMVFYFRTY